MKPKARVHRLQINNNCARPSNEIAFMLENYLFRCAGGLHKNFISASVVSFGFSSSTQ